MSGFSSLFWPFFESAADDPLRGDDLWGINPDNPELSKVSSPAEIEARRQRDEKIRALKSRMKPNNGTTGFFREDWVMDPGVLVAVSKEKFLKAVDANQHKRRHLSQERILSCKAAFSANNGMHLIVSITIDEDGNIKIEQGNHRLELMRDQTEEPIIVSVLGGPEKIDLAIKKLIQKCGGEKLTITKHPQVLYCEAVLDSKGNIVDLHAGRESPYYTAS